jgi:hypothetical protein
LLYIAGIALVGAVKARRARKKGKLISFCLSAPPQPWQAREQSVSQEIQKTIGIGFALAERINHELKERNTRTK